MKRLLLVLLLSMFWCFLTAQNIYVKENAGNQTAYELGELRNITFSGGDIVFQKTDNTTTNYALSELRYLNFYETSDVQEQLLEDGNIVVYPNPVSDYLTVDLKGVSSKGSISIVSLDGKLFYEQQVDKDKTIILDLNKLSQGIYLCRYESEKEVKTVKIIKTIKN